MAKSTIKSNQGYAVESLSDVKGTIEAGGLYKVGSIHVLNVRILTNQQISNGNAIAKLPFSTANIASVSLNGGIYMFDNFKNNIRSGQDIPSATVVIISGVFIA